MSILKRVSKTDRKKFWKERPAILEKYGGRCAYCGCELTPEIFAVDHIVSVWEKAVHNLDVDVNAIENLNPACVLCNCHKRTYSIEKFRENIQDAAKRLMMRNNEFVLANRYGLVNLVEDIKVTFFFETLSIKPNI